jgi:hypothetical protein
MRGTSAKERTRLRVSATSPCGQQWISSRLVERKSRRTSREQKALLAAMLVTIVGGLAFAAVAAILG